MLQVLKSIQNLLTATKLRRIWSKNLATFILPFCGTHSSNRVWGDLRCKFYLLGPLCVTLLCIFICLKASNQVSTKIDPTRCQRPVISGWWWWCWIRIELSRPFFIIPFQQSSDRMGGQFLIGPNLKSRSQSYKTGVARLFWSRAKFENYFWLRAALFKTTDMKVTISAKQKKRRSFWCLMRWRMYSFWPILS